MRYKYFDWVVACFVTVLLVSNIASSAKIIDWGVSIFGLRLAFDAGTLLFPISYIFGDVITEVYGYKQGRRVIWIGFFSAALLSLMLWLVGRLPAEAFWQQNVGQDKYQAVLGGLTTGAIVIASLVAFWLGEFSNSIVLARLKVLTKGRWLWTRTITSTLIGQGLDSLVFVSIATWMGVSGFAPQIWVNLIVTNYIFKCSIEILMTPATYLVVNRLKTAESSDVFDTNTNFSPFRLTD